MNFNDLGNSVVYKAICFTIDTQMIVTNFVFLNLIIVDLYLVLEAWRFRCRVSALIVKYSDFTPGYVNHARPSVVFSVTTCWIIHSITLSTWILRKNKNLGKTSLLSSYEKIYAVWCLLKNWSLWMPEHVFCYLLIHRWSAWSRLGGGLDFLLSEFSQYRSGKNFIGSLYRFLRVNYLV